MIGAVVKPIRAEPFDNAQIFLTYFVRLRRQTVKKPALEAVKQRRKHLDALGWTEKYRAWVRLQKRVDRAEVVAIDLAACLGARDESSVSQQYAVALALAESQLANRVHLAKALAQRQLIGLEKRDRAKNASVEQRRQTEWRKLC